MGRILTLFIGLLLTCLPLTAAWGNVTQDDLGLAQAEFVQGSRYYYGRGVDKNAELALFWYLKSAEKGHAKSELAVSQVLSFGDEKNPRYQEALPWLIKAEGPHNSPQISGLKAAQVSAKKNLSWMCRKGLVDFPQGHPHAEDPKCWLKRGNRLMRGSSSKFYHFTLKGKGTYHGIEKDYVSARQYLERAFKAGETDAAINLAKIYHDGLGIAKNMERFDYYNTFAGQVGRGKSNYVLAEKAFEAGNNGEYIDKLKFAAQDGYWKAQKELGWAYYSGEGVERDIETAFMYFFLNAQGTYVRERDARHGDTRLPFIENKFLESFQTEVSMEMLARSHERALYFAKENKFRDSELDEINRSHRIAVSDLDYVKETGGEWYRSGLSNRLLYYLLFFVAVLVLRSVAETVVKRS